MGITLGMPFFVISLLIFYFAPGGVNIATLTAGGFAAVSIFLILFGNIFFEKDASIRKKLIRTEIFNVIRMFVGIPAFIAFMGGIVALVLYFKGFNDFKPYILIAIIGVIVGGFGVYWAIAYQYNSELIRLAHTLGFEVARSGMMSKDGQYDIKGIVNGIEMFINVEEQRGSRDCPPMFDLEILCKISNLETELSVKPEGFWDNFNYSAIQVPYWDWFTIKTNNEKLILKILPEFRRDADNTVFCDEYGFRSMVLKNGDFKFNFHKEEYFSAIKDKDYLHNIVHQTSSLAAKFQSEFTLTVKMK